MKKMEFKLGEDTIVTVDGPMNVGPINMGGSGQPSDAFADIYKTSIDNNTGTILVPAKAAKNNQQNLTLPTESSDRKNYPLFSGCIKYFPAALAGVSNISKLGNDKHNPGEKLHHARGKSMDHKDCVMRHLIDLEDLLAARERGVKVDKKDILIEVNQMVWRALAVSQELHEKFGAPLAPGAVNNISEGAKDGND